MDKDEIIEKLNKKIQGDEVQFLKYLIDCCENILENPLMIVNLTPSIMQLIKLRAEVTQRLEQIYGIKYGKFANQIHLLSLVKEKVM